jgi:hypothetical protein
VTWVCLLLVLGTENPSCERTFWIYWRMRGTAVPSEVPNVSGTILDHLVSTDTTS